MSPRARPYRAILFDLDGTLTDPRVGITRSIQHALRKRGLSVPPASALESMIGPPLQRSFREVFGMDEQASRQALADYREYFGERGLFENSVYDGIPRLLETLIADGRRLVLATSKPGVYAERILAHFGLAGFFEAVVGSFLDGRRVDKTEIIADALAHLADVPPRDAVMIGDREHDVLAAHANGIDSIAVGYGFAGSGEITRARPTRSVDSVAELGSALQLAELLVELA